MTKPTKNAASCIAVLALMPLPGMTQQAGDDTVFVTGSRLGLRTGQIGSAVTVISREQIEASQALLGKDVLQDVPGVQISSDRPGALTAVSLRGGDNDHVLVLMDGQELGDPSNIMTEFRFDHLRAADIERIEVLRGNQSSLYGSDAIGGVINIITRRAIEQGVSVSLAAEAGSYGLRSIDAGLSGDSGLVDYRVNLGSLRADGPSLADPNLGPADEDDAYESLGFSGMLGFELTPELRLELRAFDSSTESDLDGTGSDDAYWPAVDKDESSLGASLLHQTRDGRWRSDFSTNTYEAERIYATSGDRWMGEKQNLRLSSSLQAGERLGVAFGLDLEEESTDQWSSFSGSFLAENATDSWFSEGAFTPLDGVTVTLAARRDDNDRFGQFDTHRLTAAWLLGTGGPTTKLRASWGTGAKAPGLYQLFDPFFGNTELGVEESEGYDIGLDLAWRGGATIELSYFANDIENEIGFTDAFVNLGRTRAQGLEAYVAVPLSQRLDWSLAYTYLESRNRLTDSWLGRPRNSATTRLSIAATQDLNLSVRARYRSRNEMSFYGPTESFVVVDFLGSYRLGDRLEIYGRVVNLFDEDYQYEFGNSTYDLSAFAGVRMQY